ncbi:hypothetical protein ERUR111494_01510 [Erysipelothrix urinaevulpis]|uniref:hypothetical protein n=1 Tax=Erysipelothrix urinaevulpis TaxID=2683717 RepID=UPI00135901CE|nr:hypothetical protein [Erysipelothrix urinaevulpis]
MNIQKLGNTEIKVVRLRDDLDLDLEEIVPIYSDQDKKIVLVKGENQAKVFICYVKQNEYKVLTQFEEGDLDSLRIDYLNDSLLTYEYFNEDVLSVGVIDWIKNSKEELYQTKEDEEVLVLSPNYVLVKNAREAGFFEADTWHYDLEKEHIYLHDVLSKESYEILDHRLKDSFFTKYNYFLSKHNNSIHLMHVPYNKDPYEEEINFHNNQGSNDVICSIDIKTLIESLKDQAKELSLDIIKELQAYEFVFENNNQGYLYYNFKDKVVKSCKIEHGEYQETGKAFNYTQVPQLMDLAFVQNEFVYFDEGNTVFIDRDYHPIEHGLKDTFIAFDSNYYVFSSWTEDFEADLYEDWLIVRDVTGKIHHKEVGYAVYDQTLNLLFIL